MKSPNLRSFLCVCVWVLSLVFPPLVWSQYTDQTTGVLGDPGTSFGAAWGDCDKDGDLDLYFSNGSGQSKLLRNEGAGAFSNITTPTLAGTGGDAGVLWLDFDDDGDLDLFVVRAIGQNRLLRNDSGNFIPVSAGAAAGTSLAQSAAAADYDLDGDLDLYITYWETPNRLVRNDGGTFVDVTPPAMAIDSKSTGLAWGDFDNDGDPDIYVGGYVLGRLFRNEAGATFVDVTIGDLAKSGVNGVAWGDYENDGDLDLFLARELNSSRLLRNDSTPGVVNFIDEFNAAVREPGIGMGCAWFDCDNDTDLDIILVKAGATNSEGAPNKLIFNNGPNSWYDGSSGPILTSANSRGVSVGDYDNDGFLDLYITNWGSPNQLIHRTPYGAKWLQVQLVGTLSNSQGIGARVWAKAQGKWQMREISGGSGLYGMDACRAAFGFTWVPSTVDSVRVEWPSGIVTDTVAVAVNQRIVMRETAVTGIGGEDTPAVARLLAAYPNPFRAGTTIAYEVSEASPVSVLLLDPSGRLVRVLEASDRKEPGRYVVQWDGRSPDGGRVAQGVYFYALRAGNTRQSYPVVLIR